MAVQKYLGKPVGNLSIQEVEFLTGQLEESVRTYKIAFVISCIAVLIMIGFIIAPAVYLALRKEKAKLDFVKKSKLEVYEMSGILGRDDAVMGQFRTIKSLKTYLYYLDNKLIPGQVMKDSISGGLQNYLGQQVSIQYVPAISKLRAYFSPVNTSYNFITRQ